MEATTLYLANGLVRTVRGCAEDIGKTLKARALGGNDDGIRQFIDLNGDTVTVNAGAVTLAEAAKTTSRTFGFGRVLEEGA
jgi:hypothetical protein